MHIECRVKVVASEEVKVVPLLNDPCWCNIYSQDIKLKGCHREAIIISLQEAIYDNKG